MIKGEAFSTTIRFSQEQVRAFAELSGDHNPVHLDAEYAKTTVFVRPIIHGFLSASIFSKVLGMDFPGEGTIILKQGLVFRAPMYVDEDYAVTLTAADIDHEKHRVLILGEIRHSEDNKVTLTGESLVQNANIG